MTLRIQQVVNEAKQAMHDLEKDENVIDVDWLMMAVLKCNRATYMMSMNAYIEENGHKDFLRLMDRRLAGEPLQYILKSQSFYGYDYYVDQRVLIPRFETEELVEKAIDLIRHNGFEKIMDMCTGSGCIGITLMLECQDIIADLVDISTDALTVTEHNAHQLGVNHRCRLYNSDLFDKIMDRDYELIISNPPYIESSDIRTLADEVKASEPMIALDGGIDGLVFYKKIIIESVKYLKKGGYLMFEIGYNQMDSVMKLMLDSGYSDVKGYKDLAGHERMVIGRNGQ